MPPSVERLHALVRGRVQGVYFRQTTVTQAQALKLTGWVQNLPDGTVEAVAEGPRPALDTLLAFLHHGPPEARVSQVQAEWLPATGEFADFAPRW